MAGVSAADRLPAMAAAVAAVTGVQSGAIRVRDCSLRVFLVDMGARVVRAALMEVVEAGAVLVLRVGHRRRPARVGLDMRMTFERA